jgi:hypothetical protein
MALKSIFVPVGMLLPFTSATTTVTPDKPFVIGFEPAIGVDATI